MGLFLVLPIFVIAVLMGVQSWVWKIVLIAVVLLSWKFLGPAWIAVAVALIIGIAIKGSLEKFSGSKV